MRIAIAGGHGKVALRLTRLLRERGDEVTSLIRNPDHMPDVEAAGGVPVVCDLEHAPAERVADAIAGADAVVFAAGAGAGSGPERKWTMDCGGAIKLIDAARARGIDRYLMLSSRGADPDADGDDTFAVYLRAKGCADVRLRSSGLEYTIVRPGWLADEEPTGQIRAGEHVDEGQISRGDVAAVLAYCLHAPGLARLTFEVIWGDEPLEHALAALAAASGAGSSARR